MPTANWPVYWLSTTAGTTTTAAGTWAGWNQVWAATATSSSATVTLLPAQWAEWNTQYAVLTESAEQLAERQRAYAEQEAARCREWERLRREQEAEREAVRCRAEELLLALLSDGQAETWRGHRWFTVHGSRTGRAYRIHRGIVGNVYLMAQDDPEQAEMSYCAHPPGLPAEDVCLAQLLQLATDEDGFLRVANATPVRRRERHLQAVPGDEGAAAGSIAGEHLAAGSVVTATLATAAA